MTPMLTEQDKYQFCQQTLELKKDIETRYMELCERLYRIKHARLYEAGWSSWEEFGFEFKLAGSSVNRMSRVHEVLVEKYHFPKERLASAGGWSILAEMLPQIKDDTPREYVEDLLNIAETQPRQSARTSFKELERGKPCAHEHTEVMKLRICNDCNERWREYDETETPL